LFAHGSRCEPGRGCGGWQDDEEEEDFFGLTSDHRVVLKAPAVTLDDNFLPISKSLLRKVSR
jgi:hypothetical protein